MKTLRILLCAVILFPSALWAHGDLHEFIAALEARLAENPADAKARVRLAEIHRLHSDRAAAERVLAPLALSEPQPAGFHRVHALLAEDAGAADAALAHATRYSEAAPLDADAHAMRARLFSKLERWREAAAAWSEVIRLTPEPDANAYLARATALERSGDFAGAIESVRAGIARHPREIALRERHAQLLHDSGALDRAFEALRELRGLYPALALRWWQREGDWLHADGRIEEARAAWRAGLEASRTLAPRQRATEATRTIIAALETQLAESFKLRDRP